MFYYSPKTSINSIVNLNNIGEVSLISADFFRINGGASNTIGRSGTTLNLNRNFFGLFGDYQNNSSQDPNDPSAVFVNENSLNIKQSRFVKTALFYDKQH